MTDLDRCAECGSAYHTDHAEYVDMQAADWCLRNPERCSPHDVAEARREWATFAADPNLTAKLIRVVSGMKPGNVQGKITDL